MGRGDSAVPLHVHLWGAPGILGSKEIHRKLLSKDLPTSLPVGTANDRGFLPKTVPSPPRKGPSAPAEITAGNASIVSLTKKSDRISILLESSTEGQVLINTFHFPGWTVYLNNKKTEFQIDDSGTMLVDFPAGTNSIEARFENTPLRKAAIILSTVSLVILLVVGSGFYLQSRKKKLTQAISKADSNHSGSKIPRALNGKRS